MLSATCRGLASFSGMIPLPVRQRVEFKLAVMVYKALNNLAPVRRLPASYRQWAPSASIIRQFQVHHHFLPVPVFGDRAFAAAGPRLWNKSSYTCPSTWFLRGHLPPQTEKRIFYNCQLIGCTKCSARLSIVEAHRLSNFCGPRPLLPTRTSIIAFNHLN